MTYVHVVEEKKRDKDTEKEENYLIIF